MIRSILSVFSLMFWVVGDAVAQSGLDANNLSGINKVIQMVKTETAPIIDGVMDDVWNNAVIIDDLHQVEPVEYAEPSEKTIIRTLYDENFLYISAEMHYEDLTTIVANKLAQGSSLRNEDRFRVYINPFNDGRNGYLFQVNANAVRSEAIIEDVRNRNFDWTGIWLNSSSRTDYGWFTEIAIPYKTISFDPNATTWGISFQRSIKAKNEDLAWTSYDRDTDPTNFGSAVGLSGLQQGLGLDLIPGISVAGERQFDPRDSDTNIEPSLDVFYKFTPNLTGALTFNSDFSATDVDARQVQLTRFNLFFPEQRKFFLQEADIFEFGGLSNNGKPFFSRRIGIGPGNQQLDLDVGGKLTGRIGGINIGALAVRQGDNEEFVTNPDDVIGESDLFVGRVLANVLEQSTIGAIFTEGDPTSDLDNSLFGADFNYLNTRSFDNVIIQGRAWFQQTDTEGVEGDDQAWGALIVSPNSEGLKGRVQYTEIGENFDPALGFVNRRGIKQFDSALGYTIRYSASSWIRELDNVVRINRTTDTAGNVESEETFFELGQIETQRGDEFVSEIRDIREVLTEPFEISDGVIIAEGDYSYTRYGIEYSSPQQYDFFFSLGLQSGDFFSGDRSTVEAEINWQPNQYFTAALEFEYNDIDLAEGEFDTRLYNLSADIAFNADWSLINTIQFDNQSDLLGINSRLQWIPEAGKEFFVIYNVGFLDEEDTGFDKVSESATIKLNYTYRF